VIWGIVESKEKDLMIRKEDFTFVCRAAWPIPKLACLAKEGLS
jgi:hypothetical protein